MHAERRQSNETTVKIREAVQSRILGERVGRIGAQLGANRPFVAAAIGGKLPNGDPPMEMLWGGKHA